MTQTSNGAPDVASEDAAATGEETAHRILPVGKLPSDLLCRLIDTYTSPDPTVIVGPGLGRDAAAINIGGSTVVVKSDPITFATDSAARYLVNVNANDIACLGATPRWMVVVALLPEGKTTEAMVESQFADLHAACTERGITVIGGHTEITFGLDRPILVGTLLGEAIGHRLLSPGGAKPGDRILLTKAIALEGTALIARELGPTLAADLGQHFIDRAANLLYDPGISIVSDAEALLTAGGVTALHDPTEGGLAMGIRELASAANCGAEIALERVPILPETRTIADHLGLDPLGILASGSLLATIEPNAVERVLAEATSNGLQATAIGQMKPVEEGLTILTADGCRPVPIFSGDEVTRVL